MTHFVVQEHHARHLHWDFRLEIAGVLKSWSIPKGPSLNPADKRLAVMVDDHPLSYLHFEGVIPEGEYGAGFVVIWDQGSYCHVEGEDPANGLKSGKIAIELQGEILRGSFTLVQMKGRGEKNWLLIKKKDQFSKMKWVIEKALTEEKKQSFHA